MRVVPRDALVIFRAVVVGHAIANDGIRLQRTEAVTEASGNPQLIVFCWIEDNRDPSSVGRRVCPQIHSDVKDPPGEATDKFSLNKGFGLKMNPSNCSCVNTQGLIILDELDIPSSVLESVHTEYF